MASDQPSITRLHISPLTPDLLLAALGPQRLNAASNITYHSVQTAPDKPFGYVDLPSMEADKVKKKLHGAILKGKKMKVEDARPKKRRYTDLDDDATAEAPSDLSQTRGREKTTTEKNTLAGHELSPERKVKRGWTEPKASSKKDREKAVTPARPSSKFSDKEELLFRTRLPDNKADMGAKTKKKKTKKKETQTVHEFERNTVEPTFLKTEKPKARTADLHYVDGQGWLDAEGNVVEKEPMNLLQRRKAKRAKAAVQDADTPVDVALPASEPTPPREAEVEADAKADAETNADTETEAQAQSEAQAEAPTVKISSPKSNSGPPTPQATAPDNEPQVHPLEAIFKKPQKPASSQDVAQPSLEVQTSFSFFAGIADDDLEDEPMEPLTPFTSQEMSFRGHRSAAPTPDTARPSRFNSYSSLARSADEESQSGQDESQHGEPQSEATEAGAPAVQESQFVKAFWEKRGENNRAWKARRRTVLKEKRQRENRARRPKNW